MTWGQRLSGSGGARHFVASSAEIDPHVPADSSAQHTSASMKPGNPIIEPGCTPAQTLSPQSTLCATAPPGMPPVPAIVPPVPLALPPLPLPLLPEPPPLVPPLLDPASLSLPESESLLLPQPSTNTHDAAITVQRTRSFIR